MATFIKTGQSKTEIAKAEAQVRETVQTILSDIQRRGDAAVRELSANLDKWSPESFKLSAEQIEQLMKSLPEQTIEDIKFAQSNVRRFAEAQKATLREIEVENLPGVILGHKNIPVNSVGCYIPGGRYPMIASAQMTVLTAKVGFKSFLTAERTLKESRLCIHY